MKFDTSTVAAKTVLLADSNERTCESRAKILRSFGILVDCATTARSALALYKAGVYSLMLIDLGSEGESLAREVRRLKAKQRIGFLVGSPLFVAGSPNAKPRRPAVVAASPDTRVLSASAPIDFRSRVKQAEAEQKNGTDGK